MTHRRPARVLRVLALCLTLSPAPLFAQRPAAGNQRNKPRPATAAAEADPVAEARRASAAALVGALADEARNFTDAALRANVQARAADVLWETDPAKARALFRRAWEAAEAADRDSGEERAREAGRRGVPNSRDAGSVRREVLRRAARRDNAMGDEFLKRIDESSKQDASASATPAAAAAPGATPSQRINPDNPPSTMTQRLNLASQLLQEGEVERAMQFADPALYPVNTFGMNVLNLLRERDAKAADQRFASLVQRAVADPNADANSVSLLSSYVFTPFLYITVRPDGNSHTRQWRGNTAPPADLDPRLRDAFLRAAAQILTRPLPPVEQDPTSAGRTGAYVVATRLAPLFEQYAPDVAAQVRTRQAALLQETPERVRRPDNDLFTEGLVARPSREEELQNMLGRVETAKTPAERDVIYFRIAMGLAEDDLTRAREYAAKLEDIDTRRQLMGALAYRGLEVAIRAKRAEDAVRLARAEELTTVQRAWALTEAARLLTKDSPGRAVELLEEAAAEAKRIDAGTADRARALTAVATRLHALDRQRAWDMIPEIVRASNAAPEFTGEDGQLIIRVQFKGGGAMTNNNSVDSFDLDGLFASLARENFDRAAELARGFKEEAARSSAVLAVARGVLVKPRAGSQVEEREERN